MRIVGVDDFVHPNTGYQINILSRYFAKFGHEVYIVCGEMEKMPPHMTSFFESDDISEADKKYEIDTGVKIIRIPLKGYVSGRAIYSNSIFKVIDDLQPDLLFIHAMDTAIAMQYLLKIEKKPYALFMDCHMCDMASHNSLRDIFRWGYRKVFTPIIKRNKYIVVRLSEDDHYVNEKYDVPLDQAPCISFGSDTMLFHPDEMNKRRFREENNIPLDAFVAVYAGKLDEYKGGLFLAESLRRKFDLSGKEIVFLIIGNTSGDYGDSVEEAFKDSENRILRFPTQEYSNLPLFFQASDIGLIAKECSLTFFDYQACALPVISEDNEINIDRTRYNNGMNFHKGDVEDFRNTIVRMALLDDSELNKMKDTSLAYILENYNYEDKARQFEKLMIKEFERQKNNT